MANNQQIAEQVLAAVGGKANVSSVTHCMEEARFVYWQTAQRINFVFVQC